MPDSSTNLLLYADPLLLNGALWLFGYFKQRDGHYTMIAQGLGFTLGLLLVSVLLSGAMSVGMFRQHYYLLVGVYGAAALAVLVFFLLIQLTG